ncbi:hypothetical protein HanRHA438_Chr16g0770681 [Helianthus annuus]|nr:hypothetical protein HanRHA438_Chr16g0770631 [Helianthus annuus]KAJ0836765.1 hypothetical protein HanRHA438_Chr16g0770681 [Helianthus annuus]
MFPMSWVNSVVTAADLGSLCITAKKIGRVVPETLAVPPQLKLEENEEVSVEFI